MTQKKTDQITEGFVVVGGVKVHYQRAGSGRPLLLLHGLVGSARNWRLNIDFLSQDSEVYAIDLFNMGESERVPGLDAGLEATADRLAAYMDALGLDEADIAAHSHGGAVAMMFAARHPDRVRRLILFAPANPFCDLGYQLIRFYQTRFGMWFAKQIPSFPRMLKATALSRMYGDPSRVTVGALEGYIEGLHIPGTMDHVLQIVQRWFEDMGLLRSALEQLVAKPTLLIWGDRDRAVGLRSAQELQRMLPQSSLMVLPGVGHIAFEEMPEVCNVAMRDWLSKPLPSEARVAVGRHPEPFGDRLAERGVA
ncbi:alpha/beta fold hydrolase [Tunturiibacter gelidoferens]|jgi:4,5:9,10-diseco-3-hydroxy-5,9,17-trioxoandrosta-1(10),2-diene-4-oate hydrolase|uniref:Pimeloyl-ACP methyl ester carboxylesterase n=1 Tax=Tunturiibacter gelidiferens TaxID=3069689 RepID=A0A9X0U4D0_9BACT|nr:alpha/beta fold hydrolase [Edaphobacter lichenicola]MBB5329259.1 pimeloyl-ACP methyl ester carboxylesterase [Edaphobacter lichenicola]